jgi:hypothetical protein
MARFTESQWEAVRATLPGAVDETWFRRELERIATDTVSPKKRERLYLDRARHCADLIRDLPSMEHIKDKGALLEQLKRQQKEDSNRAKLYGRIAAQKRPIRFLRQCEILQLWERAGGDLGITTRRKKRNDPHHPPPTGVVIPYFRSAATTIWGRAPGAHQIKDIVRRYRRTFKPASSLITSSTKMTADATAVKQASAHIASSTVVSAEATLAGFHQFPLHPPVSLTPPSKASKGGFDL